MFYPIILTIPTAGWVGIIVGIGLLMLAGGFFGVYGFFALSAAAVLLGAGKSSFGVPYFSPFAPFSADGMRDFLYMSPIWKMKKVPPSVSGRNAVRTEGKM